MLHLLLLVAAGGGFVFLLLLGLAFVSGWTPSDGRAIVLNRAFRTVTEDGVRLEGVPLPWFASVAIRLLADQDDARLRLIAEPGELRASEPTEARLATEPT